MMKSNRLRKLIFAQLINARVLHPSLAIYHNLAIDEAVFPHIVYSYRKLNLTGLDRLDYILTVDVYTKEPKLAEDIADEVEEILHKANLPSENLLPTFFFESRTPVPDEDKDIRHIQLEFTIQVYEE